MDDQDIDLDQRIVQIRVHLQWNTRTKVLELVELKSAKARRSNNLPDFAVQSLRAHRARQLAERLRIGDAWSDWQGAGLIFTYEDGGAIPARNMLRDFHTLREAAGLPELRFHDTRHTCATLLLVQGVPERVVMEILGHSNIRMTQRYGISCRRSVRRLLLRVTTCSVGWAEYQGERFFRRLAVTSAVKSTGGARIPFEWASL